MPLQITAEDQQILDSENTPAAPEPPAPAAPAEVAPPQEDKTVPLAALHEARQIQKELKEQLRRRDEELGNFRTKAEKMEQTFQAFLAKQNEVVAPKYEEDPLGYFKWENEQLKKQLETVDTGVKQTTEQMQRQQQFSAFTNHVVSLENEFRKTAQDYDDAVSFLKQVRIQDFQDLGYDMARAQAMLQEEIASLAQAAVQQGKSPAEVAYKMSQRYGYKPQAGAGEKLQQLQKGEAASRSLASGKAGTDLSLEALSQLDDEQLNAIIKDDSAWKKRVGGK